MPLELGTKLWTSQRVVKVRQRWTLCVITTTAVGRTKLTELATVDVRPTA